MNNILLLTDSYKVTHWKQYPKGTQKVYSYLESRGGKFPKTVFFGLQYFIKTYLSGKVLTQAKIDEAATYYDAHLGPNMFNRAGFESMLAKHNGFLPVIIKAVPEGSVVEVSNVLVTIENTDDEFPWITNFLETLLVEAWYPITVATQSYYIKKIILDYLKDTGTPELIDFKLHDFGFRGVSSVESAGIGGCAHLVNFKGTDTVAALVVARDAYNCPMAGFSIPASEHSTITSWGKDNEVKAMENMLDQYPTGLVACVSDSYDIYNACENIWGTQLKDKIMSRNGTLVIRPDSGEPAQVIMRVLKILGNKFGYTVNDKGYKVLDPHVRIIQGDGVNINSIEVILSQMKTYGWSADNIAFGSGGALLQKMDRDTQRFAFKCSSITVDGVDSVVFKDPITDSGKTSKKGRLMLVKHVDIQEGANDKEHYVTRRTDGIQDMSLKIDELVTVFENGELKVDYSLDEIRNRAIM